MRRHRILFRPTGALGAALLLSLPVSARAEPRSQALPGEAGAITVKKNVLAGRATGLSVLTDPRRRLFVQWDRAILPRYAGVQDLAAMQAAVWKRLMPCVLGA